MVERFLSQTSFVSQEDYRKNLHIRVPENFNFGYDVVDAYAAEQPGKEALLWTDDQGAEIRFTFADIKRESDRTASYFQSLGIGKGDVVMLILKRRYEFWFSILALHKLGAVVIPATHLLTKKDVVYRCNTAGIKAIVAAGERVITDHIAAAMPESPTTELLVSVGPEVPEGFLDFHAGIEKAAPFVRPERVNANDDVMMMYFTSGTTGEPKMVAHDFTYPLGHITTGLLWHNLHEGSLHLTIADTGWAKAAWGKLYGQWLAGACLFVYDHEKFTPADMLRKIEQYRITSLCAPPTVYRFLIREDLTKYDLSSLEYCTTAGEALNGAVYDTFLRLTGIRLMEGFGQTETTLTLATFPWMKSKPGSMGVPNPQYRIDLVTPDGRSAEDGEQGQIVIRTDGGKPLGLFKGYYLNDELTREAWHDGVYYTGDVAWRDEDGYYWFVGRADDVIKSSGYRIGPFEIENVIMELRGGVGGEESALFAADLYRMYSMYAEKHGWKIELLNYNDTELGGVKEADFILNGAGAWSRLKFESGVHRVQRVPETESGGRVHTSTATVAVLPEMEEVDVDLRPENIEMQVYRSSGAGGQHVNKTSSAVRLIHKPTGIVVACQEERSQVQNRAKCMQMLASKLYEMERERVESAVTNERRAQVGTGMRNERIRTYNFPQNRVTDHRLTGDSKNFNIDAVINGDLDPIIDALTMQAQAEKLRESTES